MKLKNTIYLIISIFFLLSCNGLGEQLEYDEWHDAIEMAKDTVKVQLVDLYHDFFSNSIPRTHEDSLIHEKRYEIVVPDSIELYGIMLYNIDTVLWAEQKSLLLDDYLILDTTRVSYLAMCQNLPFGMVFSATQKGSKIPNNLDSYTLRPLLKHEKLIEEMNDGVKVIGVNIENRFKHRPTYLFYAFRDGKWEREDSGLRYNGDDIFEELRLGWNDRIMGRKGVHIEFVPGFYFPTRE